MDWNNLVHLEPRLEGLHNQILQCREENINKERFCANAVWYRQFKPQLVKLVGWDRIYDGPGELCSTEAYDTAYETLYDLLPDCKHEGICG